MREGVASGCAKSLYRGAPSRSPVTEFMSAAVRALEKAGTGFGDVRTEDRSAFVVRVANEQIQSVNEVHRRGWGIRAFVDGASGYASGASGRMHSPPLPRPRRGCPQIGRTHVLTSATV